MTLIKGVDDEVPDTEGPATIKWSELRDRMLAEGYVPHHHPLDEAVVRAQAQGVCPKGLHRSSYRGYIKEGSYRAFAVDVDCNVAEEF